MIRQARAIRATSGPVGASLGTNSLSRDVSDEPLFSPKHREFEEGYQPVIDCLRCDLECGPMIATSRVRSTVALLSVLALIGNMLAGAFLHLAPAHASTLSAQVPGLCCIAGHRRSDPGCTADLPRRRGSDRGRGTDPAGHPGGGAGHCPACTLIAKVAVAALALTFQPVVFAAAPLLPPQPAARTQPLADHLSFGGIRSRAPPTTA